MRCPYCDQEHPDGIHFAQPRVMNYARPAFASSVAPRLRRLGKCVQTAARQSVQPIHRVRRVQKCFWK